MLKQTILALAAVSTLAGTAHAGSSSYDEGDKYNLSDLERFEKDSKAVLGVCGGTAWTWVIGNLACGFAAIDLVAKPKVQRVINAIDEANGDKKDHSITAIRAVAGVNAGLAAVPTSATTFNYSLLGVIEDLRKDLRNQINTSFTNNHIKCYDPEFVHPDRKANAFKSTLNDKGQLCRK